MLVKTRDSKSGTAVVDGYEVHAIGNIDVPLVGPAYFLSQAVLDIDAYSVRKIHAKKSWEFAHHIIVMTSRRTPNQMPRRSTSVNDAHSVGKAWLGEGSTCLSGSLRNSRMLMAYIFAQTAAETVAEFLQK